MEAHDSIMVYTSGPRCVDCNTIKNWLAQHGYSYTERNIREDSAALEELTGLGYQSVPVTLVGATAIDGLDLPALEAALNRQP